MALGKIQTVTREITATLKQFIEPNQLLLMGLQFFGGFNKSFQFGDLTRAYTSCVYGVAQVWKFLFDFIYFYADTAFLMFILYLRGFGLIQKRPRRQSSLLSSYEMRTKIGQVWSNLSHLGI